MIECSKCLLPAPREYVTDGVCGFCKEKPKRIKENKDYMPFSIKAYLAIEDEK